MKASRMSAIQGMAGRNASKAEAIVWTQNHPKRGMMIWKKANTPAMPAALPVFMRGSFSPFAMDTEKASIASPTPNPIGLR